VVRAVTYHTLIHGGLTNTHGSCPGCGAEVPRVHAWSPEGTRDAYRCPTCGTFEYADRGTELPGEASAGAPREAAGLSGRPASLASVLDAADCVG